MKQTLFYAVCFFVIIILGILIFSGNGGSGSLYNGEYRNQNNKDAYIMLSKNNDGTFDVIFVDCFDFMGGRGRIYPVQLESVECYNNVIKDVSYFDEDKILEIELYDDYIEIKEGKSYGNDKFKGKYDKVRSIKKADTDDFVEVQ